MLFVVFLIGVGITAMIVSLLILLFDTHKMPELPKRAYRLADNTNATMFDLVMAAEEEAIQDYPVLHREMVA